MNSLIIKGRLTADTELRTTQSGIEYCSFSVAVDRYAGKDKEKTVDFIPCKAWRQTAVFINKYFSKGKEILLNGSMNVDKYEKDGENRTYAYMNVNNVEFCGGKSDSGQANNHSSAQQDPMKQFAANNPQTVSGGMNLDMAIDDGDLPF